MRIAILSALVNCMFCIASSEVLAVGADHSAGKIDQHYNKELPASLPGLINSLDWIAGHWVNQGDFFYYSGDIGTFNLPLIQAAQNIVLCGDSGGSGEQVTKLGERAVLECRSAGDLSPLGPNGSA